MDAKLQQQSPQKAQTNKPNLTGIPTQMKLDFEQRSGLSFDDVQVHYNSDKPAQLQALAYTQGTQVYVGPGQERHLKHELGHVIQQKMGIVNQTTSIYGFPVNDNPLLERDADANRIPSMHGNNRIPVIQGEFIIESGKIYYVDPLLYQSNPMIYHDTSKRVECYFLGVRKGGIMPPKYVFIEPVSRTRLYSDGRDIVNKDEPLYEIKGDVTARPYLKFDEEMFGGTESRDFILQSKTKYNIKNVRVLPKKVADEMANGAGLHEIIPTNMMQWIPYVNDSLVCAEFFGFMGGLRTATDKTLFVLYGPGGELFVSGHTGAFRTPHTSGSAGTGMQAIAHDYMRNEILKEPIDLANPEKNIVHIMNAFFISIATEDNIRDADTITGLYPNTLSINPSAPHSRSQHKLESPGATGSYRSQYARERGRERELSKREVRNIARISRTRSPSPERLPYEEKRTGNYIQDTETGAWVDRFTGIPFLKTTPPPKFIDAPSTIQSNDDLLIYMKRVADISGFVTRPFRHIPSLSSKTNKRATKRTTKSATPRSFSLTAIPANSTLHTLSFWKRDEKIKEAFNSIRKNFSSISVTRVITIPVDKIPNKSKGKKTGTKATSHKPYKKRKK